MDTQMYGCIDVCMYGSIGYNEVMSGLVEGWKEGGTNR